MSSSDSNPFDVFKSGGIDSLMRWQYWNSKKKGFREGQITIGFVRIKPNEDLWLLFHIGKVTKDLELLENVGWEWENIDLYNKFIGRLIVRFKNKSQNIIRYADSVMSDIEVHQILPDFFDNDIFPGYDNVNVSWVDLERVIVKDTWRVALQNQKGIYLITDRSNGKEYVGSAYGENMILGRWSEYIRSGHGGNIGLRRLEFDYIKENFIYSILEVYRGTTSDDIILERERYWKRVLRTREFGYNEN